MTKKEIEKNKRAWITSLISHIPKGKLPDFDMVYDDLKKRINKILKID